MLPGSTPVVGTAVRTADGEDIGEVQAVTATLFKVGRVDETEDVPCWLGFDAIASLENGVLLNVDQDSLDEAKQEPPGELD
jgi:hypothetical protein